MRRIQILALFLAACAEPTLDEQIEDCRSEYSVENGGDHVATKEPTCAVAPGQPAQDCTVTPETIRQQCDDAGHQCPDAFVTRQTADCIAELEGLDQGLQGYLSTLVYNHLYDAPIWTVENLTEESATEWRGMVFLLDAYEGTILERSSWVRTGTLARTTGPSGSPTP